MKYRLTAALLLCGAALFACSISIRNVAYADSIVGKPAPDFSLEDVSSGGEDNLAIISSGAKATVILFVSRTSSATRNKRKDMIDIYNKYSPLGVSVVAIDSDGNDDSADIYTFKVEQRLPFPVLNDVNGFAATKYGATVSPEAYLIDGSGNIVYYGRIDDRNFMVKNPQTELANALDQVLAGQPVTVPTSPPGGKPLGFSAF